jgi:hypothetical protein
MGWSRSMLLGLAVGVVLATGCPLSQKLDFDGTFEVPADSSWKAKIFEGPAADQKVTVTASSPGAPVDVYVVLGKDQQAAQQALETGKAPATVLTSKKKVDQETTLDVVTVPAKSEFAVLLVPTGKAAQVKLKVAGR